MSFGSVLNAKIGMAFKNASLLLANETSRSIAGSHVYLGNLDYGGNVSSLFCIIFSGGLILMMCRFIIVFCMFETFYRSFIIKSFGNKKRDILLLVFSMMYFIFVEAFYSYNVGLSVDFSSMIIIILTCGYFIISSNYKRLC